jgi:hypothetical protein
VALGLTGKVAAANEIPSPGTTAAIDVTDTSSTAEWTGTGAYEFDIDNSVPFLAHVYAVHRADGIYLRLEIDDTDINDNDAVKIFLDLDHDAGGSVDGDDWGIVLYRGAIPQWGPADNPGAWTDLPAASYGVSGDVDPWLVEIKIPTGSFDPSHNLDISSGTIGILFQLFNIFEGGSGVTFNQWPGTSPLTPNDGTPDDWGDYTFDEDTFPDLSVSDVRNNFDGPENYRKASHIETNEFQVRVSNSPGTAITDAQDVRINLYLAARGIGEPWHRVDTDTLMDSDCAAADWLSELVTQDAVCSGQSSLPDISTMTIEDVVNNTAEYTIKNGVTRTGGQSATISGGTNDWINVIDWNTSSEQSDFFKEVEVNGITYRRQHLCMRAEVIYAEDRNPSNNQRQINMDFLSLPEFKMLELDFSFGSAWFREQSKYMYLSVVQKNMNLIDGWQLNLDPDWQVLGNDLFRVRIDKNFSLDQQIRFGAETAAVMGRVLYENIRVSARAGGQLWGGTRPVETPVYAKVTPGSTILVTNFALNPWDRQGVYLTRQITKVPMSNVNGLSAKQTRRLAKLIDTRPGKISRDKSSGKRIKKTGLLSPYIGAGALVGSFDNFETTFKIGAGIQVKVPAKAKYLALAVNDYAGHFKDNVGKGYRVKITQKSAPVQTNMRGRMTIKKSASRVMARTPVSLDARYGPPAWGAMTWMAQMQKIDQVQFDRIAKLEIFPIEQVMPTLIINGYERTNYTRDIGGRSRTIYRWIGYVGWGVMDVYSANRIAKVFQPVPQRIVIPEIRKMLRLRR